jgi:hypothetical protein
MVTELDDRKNRGNARRRPKATHRQKLSIQWPLVIVAVVVLALMARDWSFAQLTFSEACALLALAILCVFPFIRWYRAGMSWIPLGEAFVAMHFVYYLVPCLSRETDWTGFPESSRFQAVLAVDLFLIMFLLAYRVALRNRWLPFQQNDLTRREIVPQMMWMLFALWVGWTISLQSGLLPNLGSAINVFRSVAGATGSMAIVYLFYQMGKKSMSPAQRFSLMAGFLLGVAMTLASGFLNGGTQLIGAALLAFALGRKKAPVISMILSALLLTVLQLGKVDYRSAYWGEGQNYSEQRTGLVKSYTTWFQAAWRNIKEDPEMKEGGVLQRASLIQMLARVMTESPVSKPFLYGKTYGMTPMLMAPRLLWPDKPRGTLPTETLGIYYDMQTEQSVDATSVSMGSIVEAWANFGWLGLIFAGGFLGVLFGLPASVSQNLNPRQLGWLLASIFLVYTIDLEHCVPEILTSLLQTLLVGFILILLLSKVRSRGLRQKVSAGRAHSTASARGAAKV